MHVHHVIRDAVEFVFATALFINALLFIPQTVKIFKEKDGREISLITFGGFLFIQFTILLHGIIEHDSLLIIGYLLSIIACGSVVFSALLFRKHDDVLATSNKKSKAELEAEVNMLENIIAMMPGHVYWMDKNCVYLGCNDLQAKSAGLSSRRDIVGLQSGFLPWMKDSDTQDNLMKINNEVMEKEKTIIVEESVPLSGGEIIIFLSSKTPLYNNEGRVVGMVGVSIEITSKKDAELAEKKALLAQEEINKLKYERDLDLIRSEAHKNKIMQEFGAIAAKVAHDIGSPMMVVNFSLNKLKEELSSDNQNIILIQQSLQDIRNISGKILSTYREITAKENKVNMHKADDGSIKRYILLSALLENQVGFKKIEWQENPCILELNVDATACNIFAYIAPMEFNRNISNLLNNAYDSLGVDNRDINVTLNLNQKTKSFILKIKDTGSGIPEAKQAKVLSGESTKHEGNGIGLSGAKAYFGSNAGKFELTSILNSGTEITIELPIADDPSWFERSITYTPNTIITVLDDSSTIIMLWQRTLSDLNLKGNYFMNVEDFMQWYQNQEDRKNIILFVDYDLGHEHFTGLDIIQQVKDIRSYLVTNHAEDFWLQDIVKQNNLKLLPKKVIENLQFICV